MNVPVIASGAIADGRRIVAAFALGAAAVQLDRVPAVPGVKDFAAARAALRMAHSDSTVLTNVLSGPPARALVNRLIREVGPISQIVPEFPLAAGALAPSQCQGASAGVRRFFANVARQGAILSREIPATDLVGKLGRDAQDRLRAKA